MRIDNMARKEATTDDPLELKSLRLDLVDRFSDYGLGGSELKVYDGDLKALLHFSGKERERRFNKLVQKIRSQHKRRDDG
jgi:hypothetical protein